MIKSILVTLCIAATMTIASAQSVFVYYPEQSQPTTQPVGQCFPQVNAVGRLPMQISASGPLECYFYRERECRVLTNLPPLPLGSEPVDLSFFPISPYGSIRCELSN
ncbi:hypothetical protein BCR42DRAFT_427311, partial [Absidia repens]